MATLEHTLHDGYRADWEDRGSRLSVYAPIQGGYRLLSVWAELVTYQPAWGSRADTVSEWRAYRYGSDNVARELECRLVSDFDSADAIAAWLESLIP